MPKPGLPKKYAKMGFKKGWIAYKKSKKSRRSSKKSSRRTISRSSKQSKKRSASTFNTSKILALIPKAALLAPMAMTAMDKSKPIYQKVSDVTANYSGIQLSTGQFRWDALSKSLGPYAVTKVLQAAVPKLGGIIRSLI